MPTLPHWVILSVRTPAALGGGEEEGAVHGVLGSDYISAFVNNSLLELTGLRTIDRTQNVIFVLSFCNILEGESSLSLPHSLNAIFKMS